MASLDTYNLAARTHFPHTFLLLQQKKYRVERSVYGENFVTSQDKTSGCQCRRYVQPFDRRGCDISDHLTKRR